MERTLRGVSYLLCSLMKNQEEYDLPWRTTPDRSGVSYLFPDQEPGGRGPPLKNHPQNWSIFKDLNIRKHWCGNVQKLALTHTHPHRHAWHEHKKREKSQANWNGNFSKPVKFENLPSENNCQDAQNQNFHRVLPLNLLKTIKRETCLIVWTNTSDGLDGETPDCGSLHCLQSVWLTHHVSSTWWFTRSVALLCEYGRPQLNPPHPRVHTFQREQLLVVSNNQWGKPVL